MVALWPRAMRTALVTASVLAALTACERVDYIEIVPSELEFKAHGQQQYLETKCMARNGVRAVKARVTWTVKDPTIASIDAKALVKPIASGETELIAKYDDVEARVPVRVLFVERLEVEPKVLVIKEGDESVALTVKTYGKDGKVFTDRVATLKTHDQAIARAVTNPHGPGSAILPLDPGETTFDVQVDGITASVQVKVEKDTKKK
jgi:hypothetical protein